MSWTKHRRDMGNGSAPAMIKYSGRLGVQVGVGISNSPHLGRYVDVVQAEQFRSQMLGTETRGGGGKTSIPRDAHMFGLV